MLEDTAPPPPARFEEERLRERIVEHLRRVEHDSISGIARAVSEGRPAPIHRLTVAGYLQAMAEMGVLKEFERPPSKEYKLANPETHWSLAQRVWNLVPEGKNPNERVRLALAVLQSLLARPVFEAELRQGGIGPLDHLEKVVVPDETRRGYRKLLERSRPRVDIPARDPLYALPANDMLAASPSCHEIVRRLALKSSQAEGLAAERHPAPQQGRLELGGAP